MKDIHISSQQQKKELWILLIAFILAFLCNIYAIIIYGGEWAELYTEIFYVLTLTILFYVCTLLFRLLFKTVRHLLKRTNNKK